MAIPFPSFSCTRLIIPIISPVIPITIGNTNAQHTTKDIIPKTNEIVDNLLPFFLDLSSTIIFFLFS